MSRRGSFHDDDPPMTIESGSNRHPPGKVRQIPVPENMPPPVPAWTIQRTLDPVRAAALTAAVQLANGACPPAPGMPVAKHVTDLAALLVQYLTGEEAHG